MNDPRRVVVARYILASERHFDVATALADSGDFGTEYERHVDAGVLMSKAATSELVAGVEDETVDERIRRYVGASEESRGWPSA